jgi:hypothetical protein
MAQGPILIFDKSTLESLNLDEAVLLDNFYVSNITPLSFIECLADLEKAIMSKSTPEQLVGSLARRTPESQVHSNVYHTTILKGELSRQLNLARQLERPLISGGKPIQLGDQKGMFYRRGPEEEALYRSANYDFLAVERQFAKDWRKALMQIDHATLVSEVKSNLGPWRKPKTLEDARELTNIMIDNLDPETLLRFGINLFDVPEATDWAVNHWVQQRRPSLRSYVPYLIHLLSITVFFALVQPTQLLRDVKESHQIDLAYLYYLPFCSVFSSTDRFHRQIVPLFLTDHQTFVEGQDLKAELQKLDAHYSAFRDDVKQQGFYSYATLPPEDTSFLTTRLWDKYLPAWRHKDPNRPDLNDPAIRGDIMKQIRQFDPDAPGVQPHDERDVDTLNFVTIQRRVRAQRCSRRRPKSRCAPVKPADNAKSPC